VFDAFRKYLYQLTRLTARPSDDDGFSTHRY
jgi:hypothetical protein